MLTKRHLSNALPEETKQEANCLAQHEGDPNFVLSLARGLRVIEAFEGSTYGLTVADAARRTGLSRAAVRRLLITLQALGYAESQGRVYRLRTRVLRLGYSYLSSTSLTVSAQAILDQITQAVRESSSMSALDGDQIVYLARSSATRVMSIGLSIGSRLPAYCTSMGRVLLAGLPDTELAQYLEHVRLTGLTSKTIIGKQKLRKILLQTRTRGYAIVDEELELGLRSIAVPVQDRQRRTLAAINIGVHALRVDLKQLESFLPILRESARTLSHLLY